MGEPKGPGKIFQQKKMTPEEVKEQFDTVEKVIEKLAVKYKIHNAGELMDLRFVKTQLREALRVFGGVDNLRGKRILDIGCGATVSADENFGRRFEPWFCRGLQELGANPVGVDIRDISREEFEHHQLDLLDPKALNIFPDGSFDGINCQSFFDSPSLDARIGYNFLERINARQRGIILEDKITPLKKEIGTQIKRLLKDGGKLLTIEDSAGNNLNTELGL